MAKNSIQLFTDPETERRLEAVAAKRDIAVAEYCLAAMERQLVEDEQLEGDRSIVAGRSEVDEAFFDSLQALREKISERRSGKPIEVDRMMSHIREERVRFLDRRQTTISRS